MNANELANAIEKVIDKTAVTLIGDFNLSETVTMLRKQQAEIEYWKEKFNKAMDLQEIKPAKYTDAWWKEVEEFNKQLKVQEND
jgi:hypothetical protein